MSGGPSRGDARADSQEKNSILILRRRPEDRRDPSDLVCNAPGGRQSRSPHAERRYEYDEFMEVIKGQTLIGRGALVGQNMLLRANPPLVRTTS